MSSPLETPAGGVSMAMVGTLALRRLVCRLLGLLALLDDVAVGEEHLLHRRPPLRGAAQEELEVHREVLELLLLGVPHDGAGLVVALEGAPLPVPADGLRLLGQRGDHARERARLRRQLFRRLVVLVESHAANRTRIRGAAPSIRRAARGTVVACASCRDE